MQAEHTQDDELPGLIANVLDTPLPDDWDTMTANERVQFFRGNDFIRDLDAPTRTKLRQTVSIAEIRAEMLFEDVARNSGPNNESSRHVGRVMSVLDGWEKVGIKNTPYGKQQTYVRKSKLQADRDRIRNANAAIRQRLDNLRGAT